MLNRNPSETKRTSALLPSLLDELPQDENVKIGDIIRQLGHRSFGGLFLMLAIIGLLPGISVFAGLVMLIPGVQMALGFRAPVLPPFIRDRLVNLVATRAVVKKTIPWVEKTERFVKPRWVGMTVPPSYNNYRRFNHWPGIGCHAPAAIQ